MRTMLFPLAAILAAAPAQAADGSGFLAQDVVDAAVGDWNRDGHQDLAVLAVSDRDEGSIGIYAWLRDPERGLLGHVLEAPDTVWGSTLQDGFSGQEPSIRALDNGSIRISEQNFAVGRDRWESIMTLAWRNERFVVAGYTFSSYDSVQEREPLHCDLNLLTGRGVVNDSPVTFPALSIRIEDWSTGAGSNPGLEICRKTP